MNLGPYWSHLLAFAGGIVAIGLLVMPFTLLVAAGMLRQRRTPASSVSWLLAIVLMPFVGIPLFWLFGNRKLDRISRKKAPVELRAVSEPASAGGAAQELVAVAARHFGTEGISDGNVLKLHATGEEAYADLMAMIEGAQASIDVEMFILKSDTTGKAILDRLTARAREGVKVRVLLDGLGSFYMARKPLRQLRRAGGDTVFFLPIWRITLLNRSNLRNHRKIVVADGKRAFAGGRNLADEYLGPSASPGRWADLSFTIEGPAVEHYGDVFAADWGFATGSKAGSRESTHLAPSRRDGAILQVVPSGPDIAEDELFEGLLSMIFAARRRLWIVTPYFIPSEMIAEALRIAVQRGVDMRIIVPARSDQKLPDLARSQLLRDLGALGAKPLLYAKGMLHAKAVLVDDVAAIIGSANFDARSLYLNFEVSSVLYGKPEIAAVEQWIEGLMQQTQPLDVHAGRSRELVEGIARLIAPLL